MPQLKRLKDFVPLPIATNTVVVNFEQLAANVQSGAVDVILLDTTFWGGIRPCIKAAGVCETMGLGVAVHSSGELGIQLATMLHLGAVVPNLGYAADAHYHHLTDDVIAGGRMRYENGAIRVPDAPGLGIALDRDKLARYHELYRELGGYPYDRDPGRPGWYAHVPNRDLGRPDGFAAPGAEIAAARRRTVGAARHPSEREQFALAAGDGFAVGLRMMHAPDREPAPCGRHRGVGRPCGQSYLRTSSITLPSLGSSPGARNTTSPRSFVTSRIDATIASAIDDRLPGISTLSVMRSAPSALSTTSRAFTISGWRADDRGDLRRMHEHALHLRRLVGAAHPALDPQVGAAAGTRAGQHGGEVAGAEADQRVVGVEQRGDDDLADFARRDGIAGARTHDFDEHAFVDDEPFARLGLVGDRAEVGRRVRLVAGDAAGERARRERLRGKASRRNERLGETRQRDAHLVRLLENDLEERRRADVAGRPQLGHRLHLLLGLPDPGRETRCSRAHARRSPASSPRA